MSPARKASCPRRCRIPPATLRRPRRTRSASSSPYKDKLTPGGALPPLTLKQQLEERKNLNYAQSHLDTIAGATGALLNKTLADQPKRDGEDFSLPDNFVAPGAEGVVPNIINDAKFNPGGYQDAAKDELEKTKAEILAYKNMPGFSDIAEFGASASGQVGGQILTPENLFSPFFKVGSALWRAGHPLLSTIIGYGAGQAVVQGAADATAQAMQIRADLRKEWDPVQTTLAIPTGFIFGTLPAFAKDNQILRYKNIVDDLTRGKKIDAPGPKVTPEMTPPVEPVTDRFPGDIFTPGASPRAIDITADAPTPSGVLPEPAPGYVRLYRAPGPNDAKAPKLAFSEAPFSNATEYMDVKDSIAASMRDRDRVFLPADFAANRKPLPEGSMTGTGKLVHPEYIAVDPFKDLAQGTDASAEAARQEGIPFMVTKAMKKDLADAGYTADQIKGMTPEQAHENLRKADKGDVKAAQLAQKGPADLSNLKPRNETEAQTLRVANELDKLGPEAANYAVGVRASVKSGLTTPKTVAAHEARLQSFREKAGAVPERPKETKPLVTILTDQKQKQFEKLATYPKPAQDAVNAASKAFSDTLRFINEHGFKFNEVNSASAKNNPEVRTAREHMSNLGGAVSRLLGSFSERAKRNKKVIGSGDARIAEDIKYLHDTIAEGEHFRVAAPATEATPAGEQGVIPGAERIGMGEQAQRAADQPLRGDVPQQQAGGLFGDAAKQTDLMDQIAKAPKGRQPQTFTQWVRSQGGLLNDAEVKSIYGRTKVDLVRKNGKSMDNIREAAVQQGWLPENATIEDVKVLLRDEDKGNKHYHPGEAGSVRAPDAEMIRAQDEVDTALKEMNLHPDQTKSEAEKSKPPTDPRRSD